MFRRIPRVQQHDVTDCAAACLKSVATHYGRTLSVARLRQYASTDLRGTNVLGLVEAELYAQLGRVQRASPRFPRRRLRTSWCGNASRTSW